LRIVNTKSASSRAFVSYNEDKVRSSFENGMPVAKRLMTNIPNGYSAEKSNIISKLSSSVRSNEGRAKNKFIHLKVAFHKDDNPSDILMTRIAQRTLRELDMGGNLYVVYRHYDKEHPHIHIVASRVKANGRVSNDSFDGLKQRNLARKFEEEYNLIKAEDQRIFRGLRKEGYKESKERQLSAEIHPNQYIRECFFNSIQGAPDTITFLKRMKRRGVDVYFKPFKTAAGLHKVGISYRINPPVDSFYLNQVMEPSKVVASLYGISKYYYDSAHDVNLRVGRWPNGIPCVHPESVSPPPYFKKWSTRASKLGPAFMFESLTDNLLDLDIENIPQESIVKGRHKVKIGQEGFQLSESIPQQKLLVALESNSVGNATDAIIEGAKLSDISKDEFGYLQKETIERVRDSVKSFGLVNKTPEGDNKFLNEMIKGHLNTYQVINSNTKLFFLKVLTGEYEDADLLIRNPRAPLEAVDTRSLTRFQIESLPVILASEVRKNSIKTELDSDSVELLLSKSKLDDRKVLRLFINAMDKQDHLKLRKVMENGRSGRVLLNYFIDADLPDTTWIKDPRLSDGMEKLKAVLKSARGGKDVADAEFIKFATKAADDGRLSRIS